MPTDPEQSVADQRFAVLVESFSGEDGVSVGSSRTGFGSGTLQVDGRIFAMVSRGVLVLKLPHQRVVDLLERGQGLAFDAGKGRPMKEWVGLLDASDAPWRDLAGEALAYVAGRPATSSQRVRQG